MNPLVTTARFGVLSVAALLLAACAATVPEPIRDVPETAPLPVEVRSEPGRFEGARVRWGGTIIAVSNEAASTEIEIVARPLDARGRPEDVDRSLGRFLARVSGFLDPAVYAEGREFTVTGTVKGATERTIGDYAYSYPVVEVSGQYLWARRRPESERPPYPYDPFWYDPWYPRSMFYPYCPYGVSPRYCW